MKHLKNLFFLSASIILITVSCSKSSTSPLTSGNWVNRFQIGGWPRNGAVSFVIGDTGYIAAGYNSSNDSCLSDLWQFDPIKNNWTQKAYLPGVARHSGVGFSIGTKGYLATGYNPKTTPQYFQDTWEYNPATNSWAQKASLPDLQGPGTGARYDAVAFSIGSAGYVGTGYNNIAYIVTGTNNGVELHDFWKYDPTAKTWSQLRDITNTSADNYDDDYTDIIRDHAVSLVMPNNGVMKAYLVCGQNGSVTAKTWEYDFDTDLWARKTSYERTPRQGAVGWSFLNLKRGFVGTGRSGTLSFDDYDEWFPADDENVND